MKFSYTALTGDNKKMTGVLDTESLVAAQAELHKMGVAIIAVNEITEEEYERMKKEQEAVSIAKGIQTFTFLAADPNGKEVEGTIDSADDYSAYKRLRTEYKFKVNELFLASASDAERQMAQGVLEGFESRLDVELEDTKTKKDKEEDGESEISHELIAEIDNIIINTKNLIETKAELFSNTLLREVNNTLGELERVRTSNNVKHITEISNSLYELISNPDKAEGFVRDDAYKTILKNLENSALVKKEFDLYKKALQSTGIKKVFKNIADRLKKITESKEEESGKPPSAIRKAKIKLHMFLEKLTAKKAPARKKKESSAFVIFLQSLKDYLKATSPVLKKARKKELFTAIRSIFKKKDKVPLAPEPVTKTPDAVKKETVSGKMEAVKETEVEDETESAETTKRKWDFTGVFVEIDSFLSWLLCFYIIYFYLVNFSLEKNIGISKEFVFRTMKTPIILNITILLLILHFALRMRNIHFRHNFFATLFLICLSLGAYAMIIVNF